MTEQGIAEETAAGTHLATYSSEEMLVLGADRLPGLDLASALVPPEVAADEVARSAAFRSLAARGEVLVDADGGQLLLPGPFGDIVRRKSEATAVVKATRILADGGLEVVVLYGSDGSSDEWLEEHAVTAGFHSFRLLSGTPVSRLASFLDPTGTAASSNVGPQSAVDGGTFVAGLTDVRSLAVLAWADGSGVRQATTAATKELWWVAHPTSSTPGSSRTSSTALSSALTVDATRLGDLLAEVLSARRRPEPKSPRQQPPAPHGSLP